MHVRTDFLGCADCAPLSRCGSAIDYTAAPAIALADRPPPAAQFPWLVLFVGLMIGAAISGDDRPARDRWAR